MFNRAFPYAYVIHDAETPHGCVDRRLICRQFMQQIYSGLMTVVPRNNSGALRLKLCADVEYNLVHRRIPRSFIYYQRKFAVVVLCATYPRSSLRSLKPNQK